MKEYFCPVCFNKIDVMVSWGSTSYYCMECNMMVSSKKILTKEQKEELEKENNIKVEK